MVEVIVSKAQCLLLTSAFQLLNPLSNIFLTIKSTLVIRQDTLIPIWQVRNLWFREVKGRAGCAPEASDRAGALEDTPDSCFSGLPATAS